VAAVAPWLQVVLVLVLAVLAVAGLELVLPRLCLHIMHQEDLVRR
jgi:hypothetical protein